MSDLLDGAALSRTRSARDVFGFRCQLRCFCFWEIPGMQIDRPGAAIIGAKYSSLRPWRAPEGRMMPCALCGLTISHSFPNYFQLR